VILITNPSQTSRVFPGPIEDKQELVALIEDHRNALVPLIGPLALLKHHLRRCPVPEWVWQRVYLSP
jgi:uncharacterized protein YbgA (DUF1722 family)